MTVVPLSLSKLFLALALAGAGLGQASAQDPSRRESRNDGRERAQAAQGRQQAESSPRGRGADALSDSVRRFERSNRGSRVLSAERMQADGRDVNRIKAIDDQGRVRIYVDDPARRGQEPPRRPPTRGDHD